MKSALRLPDEDFNNALVAALAINIKQEFDLEEIKRKNG